MIIAIVDAEQTYVTALLRQLARQWPTLQFAGCSSLSEWSDFLSAAPVTENSGHEAEQDGRQPVLCLFNPADFPGLPQCYDPSHPFYSCTFWSFYPGQPGSAVPQTRSRADCIYRLGSLRILVQHLQDWINDHAGNSQPDIYPEPKSTTVAARISAADSMLPASAVRGAMTPAGEQSEIHLLLSMDSRGYKPEISRLRLRNMVIMGRKVIYLPIMPTYQMYCLSEPGAGPTLSDLLLQLLGRVGLANPLGCFLSPHPDGYLQFRPPDRSDDLVLCSPDLLRQLVTLLRQQIVSAGDPYTVLIDCAGIPLASVACLAVLCDLCEIAVPDQDGFAADAARREAGYLLAVLPPSCRIRQNAALPWPQPAATIAGPDSGLALQSPQRATCRIAT
jgi:hypothetical protein